MASTTWKLHNPGCPCCDASESCEIYTTDFTDDPLSSFDSTGWTYDAAGGYAYTAGSSILVANAPAVASPYSMKLTVSFYTVGAGTVRLWVGRTTSGAGYYMELKTAVSGSAGEVRFYYHDGVTASLLPTSNERTIYDLDSDTWYTATLCLDFTEGILTGVVENGQLAYLGYNAINGNDYTMTAMLTSLDAVGEYSAFEAVDAARINVFTLDAIQDHASVSDVYNTWACSSCGHSCYLAMLPEHLPAGNGDEVTTTGTITKPVYSAGSYHHYHGGAGTVTHKTLIDETPYYMQGSAEVDPGSTVTFYFDDLTSYISVSLSADSLTFTFDLNGQDTKYQYATGGYTFNGYTTWTACRYSSSIVVDRWASTSVIGDAGRVSETLNYQVSNTRPTGDAQIKLSIPADCTAFLGAFRHAATDLFATGTCPGCDACSNCDPNALPPDVVIADLSSVALTDVRCEFCPDVSNSFPMTSVGQSQCVWIYAEADVCDIPPICIGSGWGPYYNFSVTLTLTTDYVAPYYKAYWKLNIRLSPAADPGASCVQAGEVLVRGILAEYHSAYFWQTTVNPTQWDLFGVTIEDCDVFPVTLSKYSESGVGVACDGTFPDEVTISDE